MLRQLKENLNDKNNIYSKYGYSMEWQVFLYRNTTNILAEK